MTLAAILSIAAFIITMLALDRDLSRNPSDDTPGDFADHYAIQPRGE